MVGAVDFGLSASANVERVIEDNRERILVALECHGMDERRACTEKASSATDTTDTTDATTAREATATIDGFQFQVAYRASRKGIDFLVVEALTIVLIFPCAYDIKFHVKCFLSLFKNTNTMLFMATAVCRKEIFLPPDRNALIQFRS